MTMLTKPFTQRTISQIFSVSTRTEKEQVNSFVYMVLVAELGKCDRRHLQRGTLFLSLANCQNNSAGDNFANRSEQIVKTPI
jgi:hypothetical protein